MAKLIIITYKSYLSHIKAFGTEGCLVYSQQFVHKVTLNRFEMSSLAAALGTWLICSFSSEILNRASKPSSQ